MPDDGFRYELVKGELWRMIPVENAYGRVAMNVGISLGGYVKAHDLGPVYAAETGFNLVGDPDTVRAPDVEEKVFDWLEAGTKMVVVINARQRSAILYKAPTDIIALAEADVLAGGDFELAVREIFA